MMRATLKFRVDACSAKPYALLFCDLLYGGLPFAVSSPAS